MYRSNSNAGEDANERCWLPRALNIHRTAAYRSEHSAFLPVTLASEVGFWGGPRRLGRRFEERRHNSRIQTAMAHCEELVFMTLIEADCRRCSTRSRP